MLSLKVFVLIVIFLRVCAFVMMIDDDDNIILFCHNYIPIDKFNTECNLYNINSCQSYVKDCVKNDNLLNTSDSKEIPLRTSLNTL